jgi:predicted acyltransferase (DUF342 family)
MENSFLRYHPRSKTYIAEKRAYFEDEVLLDGNLITGPLASFWESLKVSGSVELGKGTVIRGDVHAKSILAGPGSEIGGNLLAEDIILLDGTTVKGSARSSGRMKIRPGCRVGFAKADRELELVGKVEIGDIEPGTRVVVRTD